MSSDENYLEKLFINEAKPALNRHSGGSSSGDSEEILSKFSASLDLIITKQETVVGGDTT